MLENKNTYNKYRARTDNQWTRIGRGSEFQIFTCLNKLKKISDETDAFKLYDKDLGLEP